MQKSESGEVSRRAGGESKTPFHYCGNQNAESCKSPINVVFRVLGFGASFVYSFVSVVKTLIYITN